MATVDQKATYFGNLGGIAPFPPGSALADRQTTDVRQTDGRTTTYSERERKFTLANNTSINSPEFPAEFQKFPKIPDANSAYKTFREFSEFLVAL